MSIATVYVMGASKKAINEAIALNESGRYPCTRYDYLAGTMYPNLFDMPNGTVIKIYSKMVGGSPIAASYGTWDSKNKRIK